MAVTADAERELAQLAPGRVRPGSDLDVIDGTQPRWVVEPATPEAMAAVLAWASMHGQPVVIRGGGTHLDWGRRPADVGLVVSTHSLNRITRYEPGDLTVSVEAGIPISDLNRELAGHGQWLPIDAAAESTTIGGAIATNDAGPLRHRYGTPRDQVIGVRLATADGRLAVAGGQVVKNVAGYDLGKLVAGSFGTLAGIVSATFKLAPVPPALTTLVVAFETGAATAAAAAALSASQLDPMSLEVEARTGGQASYRLLVRFGGTASSNAEQAASAAQIAASSHPTSRETLDGDREASLWRDRAVRIRQRGSGTDVRASWLPASLPAVFALLDQVARETSVEIELNARAAVGAGAIHVEGDAAARVALVARLRERPETVGHVVVTRAGRDVKERADVWGPPLPSAVIAGAVKRALDPAGVLNAGRGPI
jgi:glycolate oxidase FAD binding subunit